MGDRLSLQRLEMCRGTFHEAHTVDFVVVGLAIASPALAQVTASAPVPVAPERPVARPAIAPMAPLPAPLEQWPPGPAPMPPMMMAGRDGR